MDELKLIKFKNKIDNINEKIKKNSNVPIYPVLEIIFHYDACNKYAKKIIENTDIVLSSELSKSHNPWIVFGDVIEMPKDKIAAAKLFIKYCKDEQNINEGYKFIFWSLMILAVDKYNAEKYLSAICDFAVMLEISEEEFEDIIHVVKGIFEEDNMYHYKTERVISIFANIINQKKEVSDNLSEKADGDEDWHHVFSKEQREKSKTLACLDEIIGRPVY